MNEKDKFPVQHPDGVWPEDCLSDYQKAKTDDERRFMLLMFGYDRDHIGDARRLFPDLNR